MVTLNIGAASPLRAGTILRWLARRNDDVIVLTETSSGAGTRLLANGLRARGYATFGQPDARDRGVMMAARVPVREALTRRLDVTLPWRATGLILTTSPSILLIGVYVPSRDRTIEKVARKEAFIASLLRSLADLPELARSYALLVGDYNVVRRDHEPRLPGFFPYEYAMHDQLESLGFSAAHEILGYNKQPHSWIGRTGNGYLYDYVHVGVGLHSRVERSNYLHGPRERGLSDHAAVAVRLRLG